MSKASELLKKRTMRFALDCCGLLRLLPDFEPGPTTKHQLAKAATSVAFNYRAACRARTHKEFTSKLGTVAEEADESQGWLEFIEAANLLRSAELTRLFSEATELAAIFSASLATARRKEHNGPE
jgi:four helix bundle protein